MLNVTHLSGGYPGLPVLRDVSFTARPGEITVILGPNGCGKSTLLKTLCGILPPTEGQVRFHGEDLLALPRGLLSRRVSYLAQSRQVPDITVRRLVLHGRFPYLDYPRRYRKQDHEAAHRAMEQMGLAHLAGTPLSRLSGGQRQTAYIAMALAQDTPIVLLDEPTTYLDVAHQLRTMAHARFLARSGKTVILVLHDLALALQFADRVLVLSRGQPAADGTPEEVFSSGCLDEVFGVNVCRAHTPDGPQYYYKTQERR